jgi:tRNA 2-thiouridine synthesizing protein A
MRTLDARGHHCPVPTLRLRRALDEVAAGDEIRLLADDPMARIDVPHFCSEAGHALVEMTTLEGGPDLAFIVRKTTGL